MEIEERGVRLRLTVVDTPGFGDAIDNDGCFKAIIAYIDDQFEKYLKDESGLNRRNIRDNRVHCCFYFISPTGHGLKPLDVAFMKVGRRKQPWKWKNLHRSPPIIDSEPRRETDVLEKRGEAGNRIR